MKLEDSVELGTITLKNRLVMAPMISNLANHDGTTNENHIAYLEERAKGGSGLIITEYSYINNINARGSRNQLGLYNMDFTPKLRRLTERIHSHGTAVFAQLVHAGGKAFLETNRESAFAPSSVDYAGTVPREMSLEDIETVISGFQKSAKVAERSNFDGIEIHGAHGYLVQEFLSPGLNLRTDRYGGEFNGRIRFAQEIIDTIRGTTRLNIGIRLSLYEDDPNGYGPDYGLKIAESLKGVDYVHFSAGRFAPPGSSSSFYSGRTHIYSRLPRKPKVKTILVGSVTNREDAERILEKADLVAVGRGMLADPYFATKIIENSPDLRPCIRCNQACRDLTYGEVRCTVNPDLGFEAIGGSHLSNSKKIDIVGAGVSGLEAAILASQLGMKVTLHEKRKEIGGQLLDITDPEKKREFSQLLNYYRYMLLHLGVELKLGETFEGKGIYCLPVRVYPKIPERDGIIVDSNIYQHHDEILDLSGKYRIMVTERSLDSLDRVRRDSFKQKLDARGVEVIKEYSRKPEISLNERFQYDIRSAMVAGRNAILSYIKRM